MIASHLTVPRKGRPGTAGSSRTKAEIKRDYDYLIRLWATIRDLTLKSIAPCLIYEEASLIKRAIRDLYDKDISEVIVEGEEGYREAKDFMKMIVDSASDRVVGIHMVGHGAGDIMQGFAVAIKCGCTKAQVDLTVGIHPTAAEELVTMRTVKREVTREEEEQVGGETSGKSKSTL